MTPEQSNTAVELEETTDGAQPQGPVEVSEAEQRALNYGWKPKEEWHGPEDQWVTAEEFNRRSKLFHQINSQRGEISELKNALKRMHSMMVKNNETAYQNAINELQTQRHTALQQGDTETVVQIENQVNQMNTAMRQSTQEMNDSFHLPDVPEFFLHWREQNPWYGSDKEKTAYADAIAGVLAQDYQQKGMAINKEDLLNQVANKVMTTFGGPRAKAVNKKSPEVLSAQSASPRSTGGKGINSLEPSEQQIARTIMHATGMSEKEYMKQYRELGGK